jgi:hypothetical protein
VIIVFQAWSGSDGVLHSIWFFARDKIPTSITPNSQTIDTATLGVPMGSWPATSCDIKRLFKPQNIVMKITLCGGTPPY